MKMFDVCFITGVDIDGKIRSENIHIYAKDALQACRYVQEDQKLGEVLDIRMEQDKILEAK